MAEIAILYSGPIVTVEEARRCGELRYFTGKPCKNGHVAQRIVSSNGCLSCDLARKKLRYQPVTAREAKKRQKQARDATRFIKRPLVQSLYIGPIVTAQEARESGKSRYFLGIPCKHGHIAERFISGSCVECNRKRREESRTKKAGSARPDVCEICGGDGSTHRSGNILFDHCHLTGKFRGWICNDCNAALGFAKDDPELLRKMAEYLERSGGREVDQSGDQKSWRVAQSTPRP
jgi:hypothetical protein